MRFFLIISAVSTVLLSAHAQCLFNATHCDCAQASGTPGLCTRYSSGTPGAATCLVDNCRSDKYICDCAGTEVCEITSCDSWQPSNPADVTTVGDLVACSLQSGSSTCVNGPSASSIGVTPSTSPSMSPSVSPSPTPSLSPGASPSNTPSVSPSPSVSSSPSASPSMSGLPSATPSTSPIPEYRMFQFGTASADNMFNMTFFTDTADFITSTYQMRNVWPQRDRYEQRWHTVLMFQNDAQNEIFLCYVINKYFNTVDDGLGFMHTDVTISGADGQLMRWVACDDASDSCLSPPGTVLTSYFGNSADVTDGFCVKPLDYSGNSILLQVTNVEGARGIRFIRPAQTVKEYLWADGPANGMTGTVDANGLVSGGASPVIRINLQGILVP